MRHHISVIVTLIFIFLLAGQTCGSTVEEKHTIATFSIFNKMEFKDVVRKAVSCFSQGQGHYLGKGRKLLITSPIVSTKDKVNKEEARKTRDEPKTDVLDIAGMDYSPAKRKPPIHN